MNLLEFAIHQKLERDDKLLDYVAKNKSVPCSVLEEGLEPLIASLVDERATMLNENYAQMLQTYVPVTYQTLDGNTYQIQGEVPDTVLESIELVHNVSPNDAIAAMIAENEKTLQQSSTVTSVELLENAQRLLSAPMPAIQSTIQTQQDAVQTQQDAVQVQQVPTRTAPTYTSYVSDNDERLLQEQIDEVKQGQMEAQRILAENSAGLDDIDTLPIVEEALHERNGTDEKALHLTDALRDIYYSLVRDIKQAGLDTRLGLQL